MSVTTAINRFIHTSVAGLYQALLSSGLSFQEVANRLVKIAENAHAFRRHDRLHEIGEILSNFPLKQYQHVGQYYVALSMCHNGQADIVEARPLVEKLATLAPLPYRARAMQLLAATYGTQRNPEQELYFYLESLKTRTNTFTALRSIAVLKAKEGYHKQALKDLENLYPLARYMPPRVYFDYLNSLAVELWEVGRKYEARNVIRHVLESPFIIAYPEWRETGDDLREANRSFVVIDPSPLKPRNVLTMPTLERDGAEFPAWAGQPAQIVSYQELKRRMGKKKKGNGKRKAEDMDVRDMMFRIMEIYCNDQTSDEQRVKIWEAAEKIAASKPTEPDTPDSPEDDKPGA